jgi:hypothetical protein
MNALKFPTLDDCKKEVKISMATSRLSITEEHIVGTVWAYIAGKLNAPWPKEKGAIENAHRIQNRRRSRRVL